MKILVADDEKNIRKVLLNELSSEGVILTEAESGLKALECLEKDEFDILLLDLHMPGLSGIEVLKQIRERDISTEVIVLTANASVGPAVEAMKLGAYDYFTKPFKLDELSAVIEKAFEKKKLRSENALLKTQIRRQLEGRSIIARSPVMLELLERVKKVAASDFPVLIYGESGAGKELIAKAIHDASPLADGPFIAINCGALPENMIESELFGYERGAFTGASAKKRGLLEIADKGTVFLDEIGDMPLPLQVKLLRVIEARCFFRLGGTQELNVAVRIVSATNKDLKKEIQKGSFREDLFYRISALTVSVPPLRDRRTDIPLLIDYFIHCSRMYKQKRFSKESLEILSGYAWPGNVRELQNVVQRVLLLSRGDVIEPFDLPPDLGADRATVSMRLEDIEREHILRVLKESGGQRGKAAEVLGIDPKTLYRKLNGYGVEN